MESGMLLLQMIQCIRSPYFYFQFRTDVHLAAPFIAINNFKTWICNRISKSRGQLLTLTITVRKWELKNSCGRGNQMTEVRPTYTVCIWRRKQSTVKGYPHQTGLLADPDGMPSARGGDLPCTSSQGQTGPCGSLAHAALAMAAAGWKCGGTEGPLQRHLSTMCGKLSWVLRVWWCLSIGTQSGV